MPTLALLSSNAATLISSNAVALTVFWSAVFWSIATIGLYFAAKRLYRRWPRWWLTPLGVAPLLLIAVTLSLHTS